MYSKRKIERLTIISLIFIGVCLLILSVGSFDKTKDTSSRMLWEQTTERQLQEQNEVYYNRIYERYSRMERDLTTYQSITNSRIESLSERVSKLEEELGVLEERVTMVQMNFGDITDEN